MRQTALLKVLELVTFFLKKKQIQIILNKNYKLFFFFKATKSSECHTHTVAILVTEIGAKNKLM